MFLKTPALGRPSKCTSIVCTSEHHEASAGMEAQARTKAPESPVCCAPCRAGSIIKEIRESSGAFIKILPAEELPACALANDRVVQ